MQDLSEVQKKVLRIAARSAELQGLQLSGNKQAGDLAAAKALVRKGLLQTLGAGHYKLTDEGRPIAGALLAAYQAEKDSQNLAKVSI